MSDKIIDIGGHIERHDLELILEVNKKGIEIQTEVADQNETIIARLDSIDEKQEKIIEQNEKIIEQNEQISKDLFKVQVFFVTGLLAIVAQIIEIFVKK